MLSAASISRFPSFLPYRFVATLQTIVAGCSFATTLLKVVLMRTIDEVLARNREVRAFVVIDDITLSCVKRGN